MTTRPPVGGETHSMPPHNSLEPDDRNGVKYARTATIEPADAAEPGFELASGLKAVAQHANEKEANCNHAAIMF